MTFERLDSIANRVISRLVVDGLGEAEIAVSALRPKRTPTEAGAKFQGDSPLPAKEDDANRYGRMGAKLPRLGGHAPARPMRQYLVVIEGGRRAGGGGRSPAYHSSPGGRASELGWVVIAGGRASARVAIDVPHHSAPPDCIPNAVM